MKRVASSALLAEVHALSEALGEAEWYASWKAHAYKLASPELLWEGKIQLTSLEKARVPLKGEVTAFTDSKSVYDVVHREPLHGIERKVALELQSWSSKPPYAGWMGV